MYIHLCLLFDFESLLPKKLLIVCGILKVNNWYYCGGTLATLEVSEDHYLLHASDDKLSMKILELIILDVL